MKTVLSVVVGLSLGLALTALAGENPIHILKILYKSAFGSPYDFGMTLFYMTPLLFTGLAVSVAFQAGLFNIGAEGQLTLGALATVAVGALVPNMPSYLAPILAGLAGFCAGAAWGWLPGWLKVKRGSHEVINTIMLNFIAASIASYIVLNVLKSADSQGPESKSIARQYTLSHLFGLGDAPVSSAFFLALGLVGVYALMLKKTRFGFQLRAVGENERAARFSGISSDKIKILAMTLSGGIAGLVGCAEILGNAGRFRLGFSADFGFMGIAVALLGRTRPWGIIGASFLFAALHKGTADLDFETETITRDLSLVFQALVIVSVALVRNDRRDA